MLYRHYTVHIRVYTYVGTEVGLVRAQSLPQETVVYGLEEEREEWEGAFVIDSISGEIIVGPNGSDILVIVRGPDNTIH